MPEHGHKLLQEALHIQSPGPQTRAWRTQRRRITRGRGYCCCVSPPWCSVNHTDSRLSELFLRVDSRMSRVVLAVDWSCVALNVFVCIIYTYTKISDIQQYLIVFSPFVCGFLRSCETNPRTIEAMFTQTCSVVLPRASTKRTFTFSTVWNQ